MNKSNWINKLSSTSLLIFFTNEIVISSFHFVDSFDLIKYYFALPQNGGKWQICWIVISPVLPIALDITNANLTAVNSCNSCLFGVEDQDCSKLLIVKW